jgi:hypothetical protein
MSQSTLHDADQIPTDEAPGDPGRPSVPALRTQFDGLLELATELESRAGNGDRARVRSYDPAEAAVRERRRAVSRAHLPPPPSPRPLPPPPPPAIAHTPLAAPGERERHPLATVVVAAVVLLVATFALAVASDPIARFLRGSDSGGELSLVSDDGPIDEQGANPSVGDEPTDMPDEGGVVPLSPCPATELLTGAQTLVGDLPVSIENKTCDLGYAVARVAASPGAAQERQSSRAWVAYRLEDTGWSTIAFGWIVDESAWVADCETVKRSVDPEFPVRLCQ